MKSEFHGAGAGGERLLGDDVAVSVRFQPSFLNGVSLQELIEGPFVAPGAGEVVVRDGARLEVANERVTPLPQLDAQASSGLGIELKRPGRWSGELQPSAGDDDSGFVTNLRFDANEMTHGSSEVLDASRIMVGGVEAWT